MYKIDREELERLISNARFSDDDEKNKTVRDIFAAVVSELCSYTEDVNNTILNKSTDSFRKELLPEICVAFMPWNAAAFGSLGLDAMAADSTCIFIDEEYEKIKQINGDTAERKYFNGEYFRNGKMEKFPYYLKYNRRYVEKQELLYRYALHYDIINPVMYSPYSYKAFDLVYDKALDEIKDKLDFQFEKNGIKVITERDLYWNITVLSENKTYDSKLPYGDETRYLYEFAKNKKGQYRLPLPCNNQTQIFDIEYGDDCIRMVTNHDMDEFILIEPLKVDESSSTIKALVSNKMLFTNKNPYIGFINKRIISEADIEHAIAPFRDNKGIKCSISDGKKRIVTRYAMKYRPDRNERKLFHIISREYLAFERESAERFFSDYINYVLEFMEYFYPEVEWVGEC